MAGLSNTHGPCPCGFGIYGELICQGCNKHLIFPTLPKYEGKFKNELPVEWMRSKILKDGGKIVNKILRKLDKVSFGSDRQIMEHKQNIGPVFQNTDNSYTIVIKSNKGTMTLEGPSLDSINKLINAAIRPIFMSVCFITKDKKNMLFLLALLPVSKERYYEYHLINPNIIHEQAFDPNFKSIAKKAEYIIEQYLYKCSFCIKMMHHNTWLEDTGLHIYANKNINNKWSIVIILMIASLIKDHELTPKQIMTLLTSTPEKTFATIVERCCSIIWNQRDLRPSAVKFKEKI